MTETMPRWQWQRAEWARPVADIQAKRRARARAAHNHARQRLAAWRRRQLRDLLYEAQRDGWYQSLRKLYHYYHKRTGAHERTFWRDWRALRREWAEIEARTRAADADGGVGGVGGVDQGAGQSAPALAASGRGRAARSAGLSRRERQLSGVWLARYLALDAALRRYVPPEVAVRIYAAAARGVGAICDVPGAASVFEFGDGTPAGSGSGDVPAMPWPAAVQAANTPTLTPTPTPTPPAAFPSSDALRVGRPVEFSGPPGTVARLVRREPRRPPREWWEL